MLSYVPLWTTLASKSFKKTDLVENKVVSSKTLAKLSRDEYVNSQTLDKICNFLECNIEDVVKHVKS